MSADPRRTPWEIKLFLVLLIVALFAVIGFLAYLYPTMAKIQSYNDKAPRFNTTITVASGDVNIITATDGKAYIPISLFSYPIPDHTYAITYYCDYDQRRQIENMTDITEPPFDPTKCQVVNGVCQ